MMPKANPTDRPMANTPNSTTIAGKQRILAANNARSPGYGPDGTPGDSLCRPASGAPRARSIYTMRGKDW